MRTRSTEQEDYLLRIIQEAGRALARLREMLRGSAASGGEVRAEVVRSATDLLGHDAVMLAQLDAASAARLVGSHTRVSLWAQLVELEAESWAREGNELQAAASRERAHALRTAAALLLDSGKHRAGPT